MNRFCLHLVGFHSGRLAVPSAVVWRRHPLNRPHSCVFHRNPACPSPWARKAPSKSNSFTAQTRRGWIPMTSTGMRGVWDGRWWQRARVQQHSYRQGGVRGGDPSRPCSFAFGHLRMSAVQRALEISPHLEVQARRAQPRRTRAGNEVRFSLRSPSIDLMREEGNPARQSPPSGVPTR
ncbi:hypothetical protein EV132_102518 [Rhizobium sullae]|uniref:Uncharacterized protein n=1 Tax=Rhizobium sullae TaxID=50338 RepID=A0A4R3QET5_RHISU|nr:hypothetical protein EV132_102518 [Rhizobium sullae]